MNAGTRLTLPPEANWAIIWYNGFQVTEYQATKDNDPWEMGNKWSEPCNCPGTLPGHIAERGNQGKHSIFLTGTDEAGIWRRPRYLAFTGENTIQERAAQIESPKDLQRIPYKPSAEYWSVHEKLPKVQGRFIQKY